MIGLLVSPDCDGSNAARLDAAADCDAYADETDAYRIARAIAWQTRDLDRRLSADSDEVTTW